MTIPESLSEEVRSALVSELRHWRNQVFLLADAYPECVFNRDSDSKEGAAGWMARNTATTIGIWLAGRYEELEREAPAS